MQTSVSTSHPVLSQLIATVSEKYAQPLNNLTDFEQLAFSIENITHQHLNADTLRRLWGKRHDAYKSVRLSTLNILAIYVGCADWDDFCERVRQNSNIESEPSEERKTIYAADMNKGEKIRISWQPNRLCSLQYLDNQIWQVVEIENSHILQVGDTFCSAVFVDGETLYAEQLKRGEKCLGAVRLGIDNGIKIVCLS